MCIVAVLSTVMLSTSAWAGNMYVGATEADTQFSQITAADMAIIRTKMVLIASRSYGQNMLDGLDRLAEINSMYQMDYSRNMVDLRTQPWSSMPTNIFSQHKVVHYLCTIDPYSTGVDELDSYLRSAPYSLSSQIDAAMVEFHECTPSAFAYYAQKTDALRRDFPHITFICVTAGLQPLGPYDDNNEQSWQFGDLVLNNYRGVAPIMDWQSLLSTHADGTSAGHYMCSEFNLNYPNGDNLHPNAAFPQERLGRALLLMLHNETVPEPASIGLVGLGLAAVAQLRRRRK